MFRAVLVCSFRFFFYLFFRKDLGLVVYKTREITGLANTNLPLLILANHCSWWDGCLLKILAEKLMPERTFKIAMLKTEWEKRKWLSLVGATPINPDSPSQLLTFFRNLKLTRSTSSPLCLAYFFEGKMSLPGASLSEPKRGLDLVIQQLSPVVILPVSITLDPRFRSKPTAFLNIGSPFNLDRESCSFPLVETLSALAKETIEDSTEATEFSKKLFLRGWKKLW